MLFSSARASPASASLPPLPLRCHTHTPRRAPVFPFIALLSTPPVRQVRTGTRHQAQAQAQQTQATYVGAIYLSSPFPPSSRSSLLSLALPSPSPFGFNSTFCCIISTKRSCVSFLFFPQLGFLLSLIVQLAWLPTLLWKPTQLLLLDHDTFLFYLSGFISTQTTRSNTPSTPSILWIPRFPLPAQLDNLILRVSRLFHQRTNHFSVTAAVFRPCQRPASSILTTARSVPFLYPQNPTPQTTQLLETNPSARHYERIPRGS